MKSIIFILGVLLSFSASAQVNDLQLVSPTNFGLPALSVHSNEDSVSVRVDAALLLYSDEFMDFKDTGNQLKDLKDLFQLPQLNAMIIEFQANDCVVDATHKDVFYCQAKGTRTVVGVHSDFDGTVTTISPTVVQTSNVYVSVTKVHTFEPGFQNTTYSVRVSTILPPVGHMVMSRTGLNQKIEF